MCASRLPAPPNRSTSAWPRPAPLEAAPALAARRDGPDVIGVVVREPRRIRRPFPGMKADRAVVLAKVADEIRAMLLACVARRPVEAPPVPDEPTAGQRVLIGAPGVLPHGLLEAELRQRIGIRIAELTAEDETHRHAGQRTAARNPANTREIAQDTLDPAQTSQQVCADRGSSPRRAVLSTTPWIPLSLCARTSVSTPFDPDR